MDFELSWSAEQEKVIENSKPSKQQAVGNLFPQASRPLFHSSRGNFWRWRSLGLPRCFQQPIDRLNVARIDVLGEVTLKDHI